MKQSRATSFIKSCVSTAVGFGIAFIANMVILPFFGLEISHSANLLLTAIYTVISIARGYALERIFEAMGWRTRMSAFANAVLAERQRQISDEGWSHSHDDDHDRGELAQAGSVYAGYAAGVHGNDPGFIPAVWPWEDAWWKPVDFRRNLVKACALIIAEGERFDRKRKRRPEGSVSQPVSSSPDPNQTRNDSESLVKGSG
jgi:hypothetical protein